MRLNPPCCWYRERVGVRASRFPTKNISEHASLELLHPFSSIITHYKMNCKHLHRLIDANIRYPHSSSLQRPINRARIRAFSATCSFAEPTSRRLRQRLALPEAPSMKPKQIVGPKSSHVIFNPPPAGPNVYHTPLKFLPSNDVRRQLYENGPSLYNSRTSGTSDSGRYSHMDEAIGLRATHIARPGTALHEIGSTFPLAFAPRLPPDAPLPPAINKHWRAEKILDQDAIEEIRRLRNKDPRTWTVSKLVEKFQCSASLVSAIAAPKAAYEVHQKRMTEARNKWSKGRATARRDRARRELLWGMDA
jgi:hypothetical protein